MVTERARIDSLEAGLALLADADRAAATVLVVTVDATVPAWLADLAAAAQAVGSTVVVQASAPEDLDGESRAGWEIGVATTALSAGASGVDGIDGPRVARIREVVASLAAASTPSTPEPAS